MEEARFGVVGRVQERWFVAGDCSRGVARGRVEDDAVPAADARLASTERVPGKANARTEATVECSGNSLSKGRVLSANDDSVGVGAGVRTSRERAVGIERWRICGIKQCGVERREVAVSVSRGGEEGIAQAVVEGQIGTDAVFVLSVEFDFLLVDKRAEIDIVLGELIDTAHKEVRPHLLEGALGGALFIRASIAEKTGGNCPAPPLVRFVFRVNIVR